MTLLLAGLLPVFAVLASDVWVFHDAKRCAAEDAAVFVRVGNFAIETPLAWFFACLILWIVFFPLYLLSRSQA